MENSRIYEFDYSSWYWNACKTVFQLKDKDTVIPAKTVVNKDKNGKIEPWNPVLGKGISACKNALYIVAEDTIEGDENVICLYHGQVKKSEIKLFGGVNWIYKTLDGESVFDSIILRSQINLI